MFLVLDIGARLVKMLDQTIARPDVTVDLAAALGRQEGMAGRLVLLGRAKTSD